MAAAIAIVTGESIFGRLHPRFGTPANAILLQTSMALLILLFGAFDRILAYIIFSAVFFLGLSVSTLYRLREPVRRWWFPAAPIVFILCAAVIALLILMHNPLPALVGAAVVLAGGMLQRRIVSAKTLPAAPAIESSLP